MPIFYDVQVACTKCFKEKKNIRSWSRKDEELGVVRWSVEISGKLCVDGIMATLHQCHKVKICPCHVRMMEPIERVETRSREPSSIFRDIPAALIIHQFESWV